MQAADAGLGTNGSGTSATGTITILFGSETGNSKDLAGELAAAAGEKGLEVKVVDMADYRVRSLKEERTLLVIASTHGEGDPPQTCMDIFEFLEGRKAPKLPDLRYSVLALGDSTYEHYCGAGRRVDERLAELGAECFAERVECDVDYEDDAAAWIAKVVEELAAIAAEQAAGNGQRSNGGPVPAAGGIFVGGPLSAGAFGAATAAPAFNKKNPFQASVMDNLVLTGRGSTLYQLEWQDLLKGGALSRLDLAFSRDGTEKVYVQDRLREQGRHVYSWLEDGAWLYVCGDAARMAPDVNEALLNLVAEHGGLDREGAEDYLAELRRDRRYRLDVY